MYLFNLHQLPNFLLLDSKVNDKDSELNNQPSEISGSFSGEFKSFGH